MSDEKVEKEPSPVLKNRKTISFEYRDPETGKMLSGDFTFKRPTLAEVGRMGADIARRNADQKNVEQTSDLINTMIVHFNFMVIKAPEWFQPEGEMYDFTLMQKVFDEVLKFQKTFQRPSSEPV